MRAMKDSGQEWLGTIPANWEIDRIGTFFTQRAEKVSDEEYPPLSVTKQGVLPQLDHVAKSDDHANRKMVKKGDFAINSRSDRRNSCGFSPMNGSVSLINTVCEPHALMESRYFGHVFDTSQFADEYYAYGHGIVADLWTTGWKDMKKILVPVPPIDEQRRIADYLDEKCAEIDKAIAAAEASIAEYKAYWQSSLYQAAFCGLNNESCLIEGPVDYLDRVPISWKTMKGKNVLRLLQRPVKDDDGVITCFRDGEVTLRTNRRTEGFTVALQEIGYQGIEPGDLVVHGMDGFAGAIGVSDSRGKASPVLIVMDSNQNKRFLMYYLRAIAFREVFLALADGIRVRSCNLSWKKLSNLVLVLPELKEQEEIVGYLDDLFVHISQIIASKQSIIDDLKAYKQSLVYEVVTGKREV